MKHIALAFLVVGSFSISAHANSSWISCSAYALGGDVLKIEMSDGNSMIDDGVLINGRKSVVAAGADECSDDLRCSLEKNSAVQVQLPYATKQLAVIKIIKGQVIAKSSWARGDSEIYSIRGSITEAGKAQKIYGTCSTYNF